MRMCKRKQRAYSSIMKGNVSTTRKRGPVAKDCRLKKTFHEQTKASPMKCFKTGEHGHIVKLCRKRQKPEKSL